MSSESLVLFWGKIDDDEGEEPTMVEESSDSDEVMITASALFWIL